MVVTQHTAQSLAAFDWASRAAKLLARRDDRVVEPLVVSFTSLIRLNPEKATSEGVTAGRTVLGEAGTRPAEKQSP